MDLEKKLMLISLIILNCFDAYAFTFNNSKEARFKDAKINVYIADHSCDQISLNTSELVALTKKAADLYWNTINTSSLHLEVKGSKTFNDAFKTEGVCSSFTGSGACVINQNMLPTDGIVISCNNSAAGNGFNSSILGVSLPNNTDGSSIIASVVLLNDTSETRFNTLDEQAQIAVIAHEIGHAIGFGHSSVEDSLMYFSTVEKRVTLGQDDRDAASYLYPPESSLVNCANVSVNNDIRHYYQFFFGLALGFILIVSVGKKNLFK